MIDFKAWATALQYMILGAASVGVYVLWKTRTPASDTEFQRGYDDAQDFHKNRAVSIWEIRGYVRTAQTMGHAGPYEQGMIKYMNEVLKVEAGK
jgi:hypothetical protein